MYTLFASDLQQIETMYITKVMYMARFEQCHVHDIDAGQSTCTSTLAY